MDSLALNDSETYRVVASGQLQEGFNLADVQTAFAQLFNVQIQQAKAIVGTKRVIKKDLPRAKAEAYKQKLKAIGMVVKVEGAAAQAPSLSLVPIGGEKPKLPTSPSAKTTRSEGESVQPRLASTLSLQPIAEKSEPTAGNDAPTKQASGETENKSHPFACPKCHLQQDRSAECIGCGIIFSKYRGASKTVADQGKAAQQDENTQDGGSETQGDAELVLNTDVLKVSSIIAAAVTAVVGAIIWLVLVFLTGKNYGIVAWGIGGAIGFASALLGSKGQKAGITCATLAFLAIIGGNYFSISITKSLVSVITDGNFLEVGLQESYNYITIEAQSYSELARDDESFKQFIADNEYSEFYEASEVSDEELEYFKVEIIPRYEFVLANEPTYEEWREHAIATYEEFEGFDEISEFSDIAQKSNWALMIEDFSVMFILFLFFGIGTAYQLGSRGPKLKA